MFWKRQNCFQDRLPDLSLRERSVLFIRRTESAGRCITCFFYQDLRQQIRWLGSWNRLEISTRMEDRSWGLTVTTFWKFYWKTVKTEYWSRLISGRPILAFSVQLPALILWKNASKISPNMFMLWRPVFLPILL